MVSLVMMATSSVRSPLFGCLESALTNYNDLLLVMLGAVSWTAPEDSALVKAKTQEFLRASTDLARERGLFTKFVYANYALGTQHVLESYGDENIRKMRAVKEKYDPDDLLKSWKGGWKLFGELRPLR